jgi:hypothetical protein
MSDVVRLMSPEEPDAGPGSELAKLRWHLAQAGFDGDLAGGPPAGTGAPRAKNLVEYLDAATPAALVYVASATAAGALLKVAGEWVRNRRKRITVSVQRADGSTFDYDLEGVTADPAELMRITGAADPVRPAGRDRHQLPDPARDRLPDPARDRLPDPDQDRSRPADPGRPAAEDRGRPAGG